MLVSVGDLATDVVVRLGAHDIDPISDTPAVVSLHRGGAAANVAAVSARLGRPARFVGALGDDELSASAATALRSLGVDVRGPSATRGWAIVALVDPDGGRRFLTDTGEVDTWPAPDPMWLDGATRVHLSGYALCSDRSAEACAALARLATERGVPRSVDVCSTSVVTSWGLDRFADDLRSIGPDVVKANGDEARLLDGRWPAGATVVVTNGADDTVLLEPGGGERSLPVADVASVDVVDTTGAGDAFVAGFLAAWDHGDGPDAAVSNGHAAAARVVSGPGADWWA